MGVTNRLVYDATDADTKAASSTIGSYVLAGTDGTAIGHVADALKVDIGTVEDLDIRNLTQTDEITAYQGTSPWVIGDGGSSITVDAVDLDIRNLSEATDSVSSYIYDSAGASIGSTAGALDVNIKSGDIDDSLANTAIENTAKSVTTTTGVVLASALAARKWLLMQNLGNKEVYIGKAGVTAANGFQLAPLSAIEMRLGASVALHGVAVAGSQDCRVMELS